MGVALIVEGEFLGEEAARANVDCGGGGGCCCCWPGALVGDGARGDPVPSAGVEWDAVVPLGRSLSRGGPQETGSSVPRGIGGNGHLGVCVDVCHLCCFGCPVGGVVLDYAEGVDPDVFDVEGPGHGKGVGKCLWEWLGESDEAFGQVGKESTEGSVPALTVTQGCEAAGSTGHGEIKPGFRIGVADVNQPLGEGGWAC